MRDSRQAAELARHPWDQMLSAGAAEPPPLRRRVLQAGITFAVFCVLVTAIAAAVVNLPGIASPW